MPYKDPEKQRKAMRKIKARYYRRKKAETQQLHEENQLLKQRVEDLEYRLLLNIYSGRAP